MMIPRTRIFICPQSKSFCDAGSWLLRKTVRAGKGFVLAIWATRIRCAHACLKAEKNKTGEAQHSRKFLVIGFLVEIPVPQCPHRTRSSAHAEIVYHCLHVSKRRVDCCKPTKQVVPLNSRVA